MAAATHLKALIPMIGCVGTFVEVGVLRGSTTLELARVFPCMSFVGVDSFQAYRDDLFAPYTVSSQIAAMNRHIAQERFDQIGASLIIEDSMAALERFDGGKADIVFLDAYMNEAQVEREVAGWYGAVRPGGILCGHDASAEAVRTGTKTALESIGANEPVTVLGGEVWYLRKHGT